MLQGLYTNPSVTDGKSNTALLTLRNAKALCLFCLMRQKHCWKYFVFNQSYLAKDKITPVVLLPHEAK